MVLHGLNQSLAVLAFLILVVRRVIWRSASETLSICPFIMFFSFLLYFKMVNLNILCFLYPESVAELERRQKGRAEHVQRSLETGKADVKYGATQEQKSCHMCVRTQGELLESLLHAPLLSRTNDKKIRAVGTQGLITFTRRYVCICLRTYRVTRIESLISRCARRRHLQWASPKCRYNCREASATCDAAKIARWTWCPDVDGLAGTPLHWGL